MTQHLIAEMLSRYAASTQGHAFTVEDFRIWGRDRGLSTRQPEGLVQSVFDEFVADGHLVVVHNPQGHTAYRKAA